MSLFFIDLIIFIEKARNGMCYNDSAAIIHKLNFTQKLGSI